MGWRKAGELPKKQRVTIVIDSELHPEVARMIYEIPYGCINKTVVSYLQKALQLEQMECLVDKAVPEAKQPPPTREQRKQVSQAPSVEERKEASQTTLPMTPNTEASEPSKPLAVPTRTAVSPTRSIQSPPRETPVAREMRSPPADGQSKPPARGLTLPGLHRPARTIVTPVSRQTTEEEGIPRRGVEPAQAGNSEKPGDVEIDLETARLVLGMNR